MAWRPFAAMVLTGLSLPLAYWSRSIVPTILAKTRASLPGTGASTEIASRRVGWMKVNVRAWSAILR